MCMGSERKQEDKVERLRGHVNVIAEETRMLANAINLLAPDNPKREYLEPRLTERKLAYKVTHKKYVKAQKKLRKLSDMWNEACTPAMFRC